jgi:hypothetical protein
MCGSASRCRSSGSWNFWRCTLKVNPLNKPLNRTTSSRPDLFCSGGRILQQQCHRTGICKQRCEGLSAGLSTAVWLVWFVCGKHQSSVVRMSWV